MGRALKSMDRPNKNLTDLNKPLTRFSVVICTRNRMRFLAQAIESVISQNYDVDRYELIIIDNGPSTDIRRLVEEYSETAPVTISYYVEPRLGVSFARNLGIERARYEYVAFLDDDAVAEQDWLAAFDYAIREYGAVAAGGPVEPVFEAGTELPAGWNEIRKLYGFDHGTLYPGQTVVRIHWPLWLGGGNSVYSKELIQNHGSFRTDFGPRGGHYRIAADVDLNVRLEHAGVPIYYVANAKIRHNLAEERFSKRFIWRRMYCAGITNAHGWSIIGSRKNPPRLMNVVLAVVRFMTAMPHKRIIAGSHLAYLYGYLYQKRFIARQSKRN